MSWWFGVEIDTGGSEPVELTDRNMTTNLAGMLAEALGCNFRDLNRTPCAEAAGLLYRAIERMRASPATFEAMNPANGWGSYDDALASLEWLLDCCNYHPKGNVYVH